MEKELEQFRQEVERLRAGRQKGSLPYPEALRAFAVRYVGGRRGARARLVLRARHPPLLHDTSDQRGRLRVHGGPHETNQAEMSMELCHRLASTHPWRRASAYRSEGVGITPVMVISLRLFALIRTLSTCTKVVSDSETMRSSSTGASMPSI